MPVSDELIFELKGKLPQQVALSRMASYMAEFAILVGGRGDALFSDIRRGSVCIATRPGKEMSVGEARNRAILASRGEGPKDAQMAFNRICAMSAEDRLPAKVRSQSGVVLHFPVPKVVRPALRIRDTGHVTGELSGIVRDGKDGVKARIRPLDGGPLVYCTADERIGRELGNYFLGCVRVYGSGWWERNQNGEWSCQTLHVESAKKVSTAALNEAFKELRALDITWSDDPFDFDADVKTA